MHTLKIIFYFFAKLIGGFHIARYLTAQKVRILCYHGGCIGDESDYSGKLFITSKTFSSRVDWLLDNGFKIVTLDDALSFTKTNKIKSKLVTAITFDDGWFSSGNSLLPELFSRKIPSTLYLSTKYFQEGLPIIAVTVRYIVWKANCKCAYINGINSNLDGMYDLKDLTTRENLIEKAVTWVTENASSRHATVNALNTFATSLGIAIDQIALNSRRFDYLSAAEIIHCSRSGCAIELHGHVHSYPAGNPLKFKEDLLKCKSIIEELNLPEPKHFCYPSGNYDEAAAGVLKDMGILSATTCRPGLIDATSTIGNTKYYLPRFLDGENIHKLEFEAEMSGFSELLRRMIRGS